MIKISLYKHHFLSKFGQDMVWNIASLSLLAVSGILINVLIISFFGQDALGIFNQVYAIYIVLSQIGVGGLQFSVLKHISHHQEDLPYCSEVTSTAVLAVAAITLPIVLIGSLIAPLVGDVLDSPFVSLGLQLALPGLLFFGINKVLINTLNGLRQMRDYAIFRSLRFTFIPLSIVALLFAGAEPAYLALSLTASELALFILLSLYVYTRVLPLKRIDNLRAHWKDHFSFGARGFLSGVLLELNSRIDVLMLGYFLADSQVGIYSFAAMLGEGFSQIPLAVRWNVDPIMGEYFAKGQEQKIPDLSRRIRQVFFPVMLIGGVLAILLYPLATKFVLPLETINISWLVFTIIMIGVIFNALYRPFTGILLQSGRPGTYTLFIVSLVFGDALLNLLLIPFMGMVGAGLVTGITYAMEGILLIVLVKRIYDIRL